MGIAVNLIGIAVILGIVFGTDWSLWVSIPVGFACAIIVVILIGYAQGKANRENMDV